MKQAPRTQGAFTRWLALFCLASALVSVPVRAGPYVPPNRASALRSRDPRILPTHLSYAPRSHWLVGVALEQYGRSIRDSDTQLGLVGGYRVGPFSPTASLLVKPGKLVLGEVENSRWLMGVGFRSYFDLLGLKWSYGISTHFEARLEDHFWLAFASPLELGAVLLEKNSWQLEVFAGARRALGGDLIDFYLVDPNGLDNEIAQTNFDRARFDAPWRGFVRLVFFRRVD